YLFTVPVDRTLSALSLHDALPISLSGEGEAEPFDVGLGITPVTGVGPVRGDDPLFFQEPNLGDPYRRELGGQQRERGADAHRRRSEEHTSELQSRFDLVCRLLLEK